MCTEGMFGMAICITAVLSIGQSASAAEVWRVNDQPDLKRQLEQAPILQTESQGEPSRGVNVWERWMVPNPDGQSWDVLQVYFKEYYGPTWLYAVDLGSGEVKKQRLPDGRQFYLSGRALAFDGKYYIATPGPTGRGYEWGMFMHIYDAATNIFAELGQLPVQVGGEVRPLVVGNDGMLYGSGSAREGKLGLYAYDPKLRQVVRDYGLIGPSHPNGAWSGYVMGADDQYVYLVSGMIPTWYLVSVHLETGEQKVMYEAPPNVYLELVERFPGSYLLIPPHGDEPRKDYWLYHGEMIPKVDNTPPWPAKPSSWDKAVPKPEVYFDQIEPDAEGHAILWYRSADDARKANEKSGTAASAKPEELGWKAIRLENVETYSQPISDMCLLPDGRLYGGGGSYIGWFLFEPQTDQTTVLGRNEGLSPYTHIVSGDKVYSCGYPGGPLFVYEPSQPYTLHQGVPPGHPAPKPRNPRYLGSFERATRCAVIHDSALGADGRIYFGGFGERHYTGGGFGWYDPRTDELGGFWEPLSGYAVFFLAPAQEGRFIVISTATAMDERNENRTPEAARLFVYDVTEKRIVRDIVPVAGGRATGLIAEVAPGRLLGLTTDPERPDGSILYGVDVVTGQMLFQKALPVAVSTDKHWPHWANHYAEYNAFVRGPDGFIWTYLRDVLVRIQPEDASIYMVGKVAPPGRPVFVGNDLYFAGAKPLRRLTRNRVMSIADAPLPEEAEPLKVIFDTDMDGDNDDVAAAAILHALADAGKVDILATGVVSRHPYSPACLDAINTYYGRGDIPVGVYKGTTLAEMGSPYAREVAERCPNNIGLSSQVPDVVGVYRRVLSSQSDGTVTIIAVGQMNNLVNLLASPPDQYSHLSGRELVRCKVTSLFVMAPYFNERNEYQRAYNFVSSPKAALELIAQWPTKIKFGEGNLGHRHFIGGRLSETPADNPARIAFEAYFAARGEKTRHCADPATVLYAVCGTQYFGEVGPGACDVREDGYTRWNAALDKQHFYNTQKLPVGELEQVMEELLIKPPKLQR